MAAIIVFIGFAEPQDQEDEQSSRTQGEDGEDDDARDHTAGKAASELGIGGFGFGQLGKLLRADEGFLFLGQFIVGRSRGIDLGFASFGAVDFADGVDEAFHLTCD